MSGQNFEGLPRALVLDGWWMSADAQFDDPMDRVSEQTKFGQRARWRMLLLVALLALADVLFFQQAVGISLVLFAVTVFAASVLEAGQRRIHWPAVLVLGLSVLPVVEYVQFFSVVFLVFGLIVSIAWQRLGPEQTLDAVLYGVRRLILFLPVGAVQSIDDWVKAPSGEVDVSHFFRAFLRNWAFPVGGGLLILSLLMMANPVLERLITNLVDVDWDVQRMLYRAFFWLGAALVLSPVLSVTVERLQRPHVPSRARRVFGFGLNATSVSNALWVFNALLAVQLVMDGTFVVSGELPYDMSYARYAHRGAYPLVVTALLAGCFALAARPFLDEGRWLKPLMIVWLGLNALLTVSSMYRLGIYVEAYGLTYLRVRAGIWMVLVATWLGLIAWQIIKSKVNGWLVMRSFAMGIGVLYVGCFVNFAEVIASHNESHPRHQSNNSYTFCQLIGTSITANRVSAERDGCDSYYQTAQIDGWRDWGFREWRVLRYVEGVQAQGASHENLGR